MGLFSARYFGKSCFVTVWVFKLLLLYTEAGPEQTAAYHDNWLKTRGVKTFMCCNLFSDDRASLLCFQVILFRGNIRTSLWKFVTLRLSKLCSFPLRRFTLNSQRNLRVSFRQDWRKRLPHLWEKDWNTCRVEKICVFIVQEFLVNSVRPGYRTLREWIRCSFNNEINCLFVATSLSKNDRREQMIRLDTSQLALIRVPIKHHLRLHHITGRMEENNVRVLQLSVAPKFVWTKQVVLNVNSIQSTMFSSSSNIKNCSWISNFSNWIVKD